MRDNCFVTIDGLRGGGLVSILVHEQASDELKNKYRENGVVKIEQVVSNEWLEKLSSVADSQLANPGP